MTDSPSNIFETVFEHLHIGVKVWKLEDPSDPGSLRLAASNPAASAATGDGKPHWIIDVMQDTNFPRASAATDIGVKGAFGFPVMVKRDVAAVLEFFAPESKVPDHLLLDVMEQVGIQLGRVIERKRMQTA